MKCVHIQTIVCQGHSGKRKFSQDNNISKTFKGFLCSFGNILIDLTAMKLNKFFNTEIFHLQSCHFAYIQTGIQTATMSIFRQIDLIFLLFIILQNGPFIKFSPRKLVPHIQI